MTLNGWKTLEDGCTSVAAIECNLKYSSNSVRRPCPLGCASFQQHMQIFLWLRSVYGMCRDGAYHMELMFVGFSMASALFCFLADIVDRLPSALHLSPAWAIVQASHMFLTVSCDGTVYVLWLLELASASFVESAPLATGCMDWVTWRAPLDEIVLAEVGVAIKSVNWVDGLGSQCLSGDCGPGVLSRGLPMSFVETTVDAVVYS